MALYHLVIVFTKVDMRLAFSSARLEENIAYLQFLCHQLLVNSLFTQISIIVSWAFSELSTVSSWQLISQLVSCYKHQEGSLCYSHFTVSFQC